MNITIARPRCQETVSATVFDGVNRSKFHEWPISLSSRSSSGRTEGEIDLSGDYMLLVHFFVGNSSDAIGTIVLPAERLRRLSDDDTQRIWMAIGDKFINERPAKAEAIKYFDRLISEEDSAMRLPVLFSTDLKWNDGCKWTGEADRSLKRQQSSDCAKCEVVPATPTHSSPRKSFLLEHKAIAPFCRARNQSIMRYSELGQGVTALRCFQAWASFWLEEKRGMQAMQLFSELEAKQHALESQALHHAGEMDQAVAQATDRYARVFDLWKARVVKKFDQDTWHWVHNVFSCWRDQSTVHHATTFRWFFITQSACQMAARKLIASIRLNRMVSKLMQSDMRYAWIVHIVFQAWKRVFMHRRRFVVGISALISAYHREACIRRKRCCFSAWFNVLSDAREAKEIIKERQVLYAARRARLESVSRVFSQCDRTQLTLVFFMWRNICTHVAATKRIESANDQSHLAQREVEKAMVDKQALGERLECLEKEMMTAQEQFDSTGEFRDQQYTLLHDMYQNVNSELDELKAAELTLEELRRTSLSDKLRLQSTIEELTSSFEEANSEKEKAVGRVDEVEKELEGILKENESSQKQTKDLEKRIDRQKRQNVLHRQESKQTLLEKTLEIDRLNSLREKETLSAQLRLQKGAIQSRTLQKKLISNESQVAQLACLDTEKAQLERKVTLLEKEQRRSVSTIALKDRELAVLREECKSLKALEKSSSGSKTLSRSKKGTRVAGDIPRKEPDEFERLQQEMDDIERENELLMFACGREELIQHCKVQEIEIMRVELEKGPEIAQLSEQGSVG